MLFFQQMMCMKSLKFPYCFYLDGWNLYWLCWQAAALWHYLPVLIYLFILKTAVVKFACIFISQSCMSCCPYCFICMQCIAENRFLYSLKTCLVTPLTAWYFTCTARRDTVQNKTSACQSQKHSRESPLGAGLVDSYKHCFYSFIAITRVV